MGEKYGHDGDAVRKPLNKPCRDTGEDEEYDPYYHRGLGAYETLFEVKAVVFRAPTLDGNIKSCKHIKKSDEVLL